MSAIAPTWIGPDAAENNLRELSLQMCGGEDLDSYLEEFLAKGQSQCTNVWSKGIIAYRCRTCQLNDSRACAACKSLSPMNGLRSPSSRILCLLLRTHNNMHLKCYGCGVPPFVQPSLSCPTGMNAICVECFKGGNHGEHDYVMYHSESGGCCDCGDRAAWKESGFCTAHQCLNMQAAVVKSELLDKTHMVVKSVLKELLAWVMRLSESQSSAEQMEMALLYLNWLQKVCAVDALRNIMCEAIVVNYIPQESERSTSPLDILLDYLAKMPERIIEAETTLFLQLLYKNEFKIDFLQLLKDKYEDMIVSAVDDQKYLDNYTFLDTNLDRVMVQLFNDPDITTILINKYELLELFIGVFSKVVSCCAENELAVVDVEKDAIKGKVYLRPQGDLRLIVAHGNIAVNMLREQPEFFPRILDVLVKLQWMNPYTHEDDVEFENSWTLAIQLEMNSMAIIYQLVSRCYQDPSSSKETLVKAATYTLKALKQYLGKVNFSAETVSLHIPLHRTLSAILQKLVLLPWDEYEDGFYGGLNFDYSEDEVLDLMEHPLRISVWMAQIRAQIWRRISEEFSRLELIYRGSFWHDQSMDMDILLLQFCCVAHGNMQEKIFVRIAERFDLKKMVTSPVVPDDGRRPQSKIVMLQDFMRLILLVVRERRNLGRPNDDDAQDKCLQYDVIQWLCVRDQTYSQLCRALSVVPMDHKKLNAMLKKVAIYHEPKVADRGYYELKPEYWKEFDPLFAHYYLNELEEAEDRAVKVGKLEHYWRIKAPPVAAAPYDRLSNLLHTKACHLFLMNVLREVVNLVKLDTSATSGEALGVTALQMMAVLVSDLRNKTRHMPSKPWSAESQEEFPTDDIAVNIDVKLRVHTELHPSIHEMLRHLRHASNCPRLVDSVNHVFGLLSFSTNEKSFAAEIDSVTAEDIQRKLRKEQRQKAILEEFAAKRKVFLEQQDVSDDDECAMDGSNIEVPGSGERASGSMAVMKSASEALTEDEISGMDVDCASTDTADEARECVLCRGKSDVNSSSTCWIGLVQQYNLPNLMMLRGELLENLDDKELLSTSNQVHGEKSSKEGVLEQLVTVICPANAEESTGSCIDLVTAEHVQCCGHQMHFDCFQGHVKTLQSSHHGTSGYAGKGILELNNVEFLCPICRRLANVLLPDVDASISSKKLLQEDVKGGKETKKDWNRFWQSNKNLETAINFFALQAVRARGKFLQHDVTTNSFINCKALWEGLALNIVHCEVETREGPLKEAAAASSSSAPTQLFDERNWGGDSAHWIALRELGKLAVLSNTLPGAVQGKVQMLETLRQSLGLLEGMVSELEEIVHEIFPPVVLDIVQPLESADVALETLQCEDEVKLLNVEVNRLICDEAMEDRKEKHLAGETKYDEAHLPLSVVESKAKEQLVDSKPADTHATVPAAPATQQKDKKLTPPLSTPQRAVDPPMEKTIERKPTSEMMEDTAEPNEEQPSSLGVQEYTSFSCTRPQESQTDWTSDILKTGVLGADPFGLLIVLLITVTGLPQKKSMRAMVRFAYTVAVLQTFKAVARLGVVDAVVERDLVQRACLPFLRRAALLVQIVTRKDFKGQFRSPGMKVMDPLYLQQALQLPDYTEIMRPKSQGASETLATALQRLHTTISDGFIPKLLRVPRKVLLHKLPRVFQDLLLENIHTKKPCRNCGNMPEEPAICLLCGELLCCRSDCCKKGVVGECTQHAAKESAGVGIFLLLRSTQLLLLRNNRSCMGLSLYLDVHGEEDLYLRRSQLLYLSDLRLNEVRRLWMTAAFDYDSYILRNSQSKPNYY